MIGCGRWLALVSCLGVCACTDAWSWWGYDPVAALLVNPSDADRQELSRVVGEALHRAPVLLAPDALTRDSTLIIAPVEARDASGLPLDGRDLRRPERFHLVRDGSRCYLILDGSDKHWKLSARCQ
jgi:hypothetical protein